MITNKELRLKIRALGEGRALPLNTDMGLCYFLRHDHTYDQCQTVTDLMQCWPGFSGRRTYPVPHPNDDPHKAFVDVENLWEPKKAECEADRQYIKNRLSMCCYIARKLAQLEDWK